MIGQTFDHWVDIAGYAYKARTYYTYVPYQRPFGPLPAKKANVKLGDTKISADGKEWYCIPLTKALEEEITEEAWAHLKDGQ